ncbi:MAG: cation-translocating P-type ATPase [Coriobacteriales bacterium]|jgi:Ca2+-transporting ATPase|nr:cation-translocating P-type ATPase [Coriobacteriales bacterium]
MDHFLLSAEEVTASLDTSQAGLSSEEAAARLAAKGRNELVKAKGKSLPVRILEQLIDPMVLILLVAAVVSVLLAIYEGGGFKAYAEAGIILSVVIINSVLGVYQETKAEKAIEALQQMSAAVAKVKRDGLVIHLAAAELVVGDIVLIEAGDAIPADIRLTQSAALRIEEAALTGESVPASKQTDALIGDEDGKVSLGDRKNMAYMGSSVVFGRGEGVVVATGMATEMGKIADIIQSTAEGETPLQKRLTQLSKVLTIGVLAICAVVFIIDIIRAEELVFGNMLNSFMLAVSLAVAAIPEGLVAVVTIVLSIGVTNMAKRNAIIRRLTAVETLGCAQVICSDKTGTLTQNKMTVVESYGDLRLLTPAMVLCSDSKLSDGEIVGDPTENALVAFAIENGISIDNLLDENPRIGEAPFDSVRKMMTTVHQTKDGIIQYSKGAADIILPLCSHAVIDGQTVEMTDELIASISARQYQYSTGALRVLAAARRYWPEPPLDFEPETLESKLTFIGLEAMIDPVRPEVKAAVEECKNAGIRVVMITGDHKDTAVAIASQLDIIDGPEQAISGKELDNLSDQEFAEQVTGIYVYARVQPEHKVRIVNMWRRQGFVAAMTGDGVNDAPALKSADIGVGMGIAGTDVTKNVADMVLADDNFATIVSAVEEGRVIYDNIRRTIQFLLGSNLAEVISVFTASLVGFVLFRPVHLLFINMVTDSIPAIALGIEAAESDIMQRSPRGSKDSFFSEGLWFDVIYQGIVIAILTLAAYFIVDIWEGHAVAMTSAFFTMSMCEIFHAFNMRSRRESIFRLKSHNRLLWAAMTGSLLLTLSIIYVPVLAEMFSLEPLTLPELATALGLSISVIPIVEVAKALQRAIARNK